MGVFTSPAAQEILGSLIHMLDTCDEADSTECVQA